jgi:cation/acetate symporter
LDECSFLYLDGRSYILYGAGWICLLNWLDRWICFVSLIACAAVCIAGYFGINPPGFVAQVVAFAFGLAASSFFPAILLGIFSKRMNKEGAIAGMIAGILFTAGYIIYFKFLFPEMNTKEHWWFGISPEGIGTVGIMVNFVVSLTISKFTPGPPLSVREMVERLRIPRGSSKSHELSL